MSRFSFEPVDNSKALELWEDSPQAGIFTHPGVLSTLSFSVEWWLARKGVEPFCLWPVCTDAHGLVILPGFTYYTGPLWTRKGLSIPVHRWLADSTRVYQGLCREITSKYGALKAQLPPGLNDVRIFSWWNYHQPEKPGFAVRPKYTARLYNLQKLSPEDILQGFRPVRRKEIRRLARRESPARAFDWTQQELLNFFCRQRTRQGLSVTPGSRQLMHGLICLVQQGWGEIVAFRCPEDNQLACALVLLRARGVCNLVLNATRRKWQEKGLTAWTIYHGLLCSRSLGDEICDFNGANSPDRGDDKHSYGAEPALFFEIEYPA